MQRKTLRLLLTVLISLTLIIGFTISATAEEPQYGGTLRVFPVYATIPPLSWDAHDWNWKVNQDTGLVYEHLLAGDLQKGPRGSNEFDFKIDAWIPPAVVRGELAESFELKKDPLRLEFQLRKGIFWQAREGVMKSREFVADDVVEFFNRVRSAEKAIPKYWDFIDRWEAQGKYKVTAFLKECNANWQYKFCWGYYDAISPPEVAKAGARKWKNVTGTGPFSIEKYQKGNYTEYVKNPNYWDHTKIGSKEYKLPFVDKIQYLINKDEQSCMAALRSARVDIMTTINTKFVKELKQAVPELKWAKWLYNSPILFAMRMDTKPFDDIRVRRAMALAINQEEIRDKYWNGDAELFAYPFPPNWKSYYVPLSQQPKSIQELYTYNPAEAKKLLAEAGYPNGFTVKAQVNNYASGMEQAELVAAYLAKVGVKLELEPLEYRNYMTMMIRKKHGPAYFHSSGQGNPISGLRKNFMSKQTWNAYMLADKSFDEKWEKMVRTMDEAQRIKLCKELQVQALEQVPFVQLPAVYTYTAWWPWVKNFYGELRVGAERYGPIHARIWIDQQLKKKLGH